MRGISREQEMNHGGLGNDFGARDATAYEVASNFNATVRPAPLASARPATAAARLSSVR